MSIYVIEVNEADIDTGREDPEEFCNKWQEVLNETSKNNVALVMVIGIRKIREMEERIITRILGFDKCNNLGQRPISIL